MRSRLVRDTVLATCGDPGSAHMVCVAPFAHAGFNVERLITVLGWLLAIVASVMLMTYIIDFGTLQANRKMQKVRALPRCWAQRMLEHAHMHMRTMQRHHQLKGKSGGVLGFSIPRAHTPLPPGEVRVTA